MNENLNPYSPPQSAVAPGPEFEDAELVSAAVGWRLLNYFIDFFMMMILVVLLMFIIALGFGDPALEKFENTPDILLGLVLMLIYYVPCEWLWGRTLGKLITGTRVVDEQGGRPSLSQVVGRTLCRFIPFEFFSFLFGDNRGWHDSIPKTLVIKTRR